MPLYRKDAEFAFFTRKCAAAGINLPANSTLTDYRRSYWAKQVNSTNNQEMETDLEWKWLKTLPGVTGKTLPDMWREAVVGLAQAGLQPSNDLNENITLYYTLAP